eukprot:scaffold68525_cov63-Phaeocystis_antarctica.AAC.1
MVRVIQKTASFGASDPLGTADHLGDPFAAETGARWSRVTPATVRLPGSPRARRGTQLGLRLCTR